MDEPTPSARKLWSLRSLRTVSPQLERWLGRLALGLLWGPLLFTTLPQLLRGTALGPMLAPLAHQVGSLYAYTFLGSALAGALLVLLGRRRTGGTGALALDSRSIYLLQNGERRIPRGLIVEGLVRPGERPELELHLASGEIVRLGFEEGEDAQAQAVLDALALGSDRRRVAITLGERSGRVVRNALVAGGTLVGGVVLGIAGVVLAVVEKGSLMLSLLSQSWAFVLLALTLLALRTARYTEIVVGAEGLVIKRPWSTKLVLYAQLREAVVKKGALLLRHRRGVDEVVRGPSQAAIEAIARRVNEAMEHAQRAEGVARSDWLARRGRPLSHWRASVTAALRPGGGYRAAMHAPDDAVRILEDPRASAERRIGAALALVGSEEAGAAERIRVAAEACASDKLRIALTNVTAAEPDQAAIEAVFAEEAAEADAAVEAAPRSP